MVMVAATGLRSLPAISRILTAVQRIKRASPFIDIASKELSPERQISKDNFDGVVSTDELGNFQHLCVKDLSFSYETQTDQKLLDSVNLDFRAGQSIGIVGESGSGKTTLMDLILGLIEFKNGSIQVNDKSILTCTEAWQQQVGYLSQHVFIFEGTLRENIAIGIPLREIDANGLDSAIKAAQLHDFIATLPEGLETRVGEAGARLSGGQRQRVGIARLLYRNPDILFMDEPTASLDRQTADDLWKTLKIWGTKKTMVVISHDEAMLQDCEKVIKVSGGKISTIKSTD